MIIKDLKTLSIVSGFVAAHKEIDEPIMLAIIDGAQMQALRTEITEVDLNRSLAAVYRHMSHLAGVPIKKGAPLRVATGKREPRRKKEG